jgi:tetratricopeptide (TPR) repeat protein
MSTLRKNKTLFALAALLLAIAVAIGIGCGRKEEEGGAPPIDTELMAFLSEARALHHQANLKEEGGDIPGAVDAMQRLVNARRPHPDKPTPEVDEVLADAYARLAELQLKRNQIPPASEAIQNGLKHAPDATYFRGHLLEVQGLVEEARAAQLAAAGNTAEAAKAREKAIQLLEEVVKIQDQVIQRSLAGKEAGR